MINNLHVENFTVFRKADFEFVPGINVLVGGNATGKTHVLKLLYAMQKYQMEAHERSRNSNVAGGGGFLLTAPNGVRGGSVMDSLVDVFRPGVLGELTRKNANAKAVAVAAWNGSEFAIELSQEYVGSTYWQNVTRPVYIPPKDMLAHSDGFSSLYRRRELDFDVTYPDIVDAAITPALRESERLEFEPLLDQLLDILKAKVEVQGETVYLRDQNGSIEMHMVAEGWRKIALLYLLIANGSIAKDTVLYWDEPESNLNPSLMDEVVDVMLSLARMGTQIFLATHEYIILKELELQKKPADTLRMFALERSKKDGSVSVHPAEEYSELRPNLIADQFDRLYDLTVDRALGVSNAD